MRGVSGSTCTPSDERALRAVDKRCLSAPLATVIADYAASIRFVAVLLSALLALDAFCAAALLRAAGVSFAPAWAAAASPLLLRWLRVIFVGAAPLTVTAAYLLSRSVSAMRCVVTPYYQLRDCAGHAPWQRVADEVACVLAASRGARGAPLQPHASLPTLRAVYAERMGNNVFQYVMARLRAEYLGLAFSAPRISAPFHALQGMDALQPPPAHSYSPLTPATALHPAAAALLQQPGARRAWVRWMAHSSGAYVMDTRLFAAFHTQVRAWLAPACAYLESSPHLPAYTWAPNDVVMHVRLGDILYGHHTAYRPLPLSFYLRVLRGMAADMQPGSRAEEAGSIVGRVLMVTEDRTHSIIHRMRDALRARGFNVSAQSASLAADFKALASAPNLVLSISSFAWWAAWLGRAQRIAFPEYGLFARQHWLPRRGAPSYHDMTIRSDAALDAALDAGLDAALQDVLTRAHASATPAALAALLPVARMMAAGLALCADDADAASTAAVRAPHVAIPAGLDAECAAVSALLDASSGEERLPAQHVAIAARIASALEADASAWRSRLLGAPPPRFWLCPLPHLRKWDGNFDHTVRTLFDEE